MIHPSWKAVWRENGIACLLDWINSDMAVATYLGLWGSSESASWAWLLRDGARLREQPGDRKQPTHLIPIRLP